MGDSTIEFSASSMTIPITTPHKHLVSHFAFYAAYHNNRINQIIHIVCVPLILITAFVFLVEGSFEKYLPSAAQGKLMNSIGLDFTAAVPIALAYALYYLYLSPTWLGGSAAVWVILGLYLAQYWIIVGDSAHVGWILALVIHVICWIAQFYGHGVHEHRSPALLDNLFQALFMAPIFVYIEVLISNGFLKAFHELVEPIVNEKIAQFRYEQEQKDNAHSSSNSSSIVSLEKNSSIALLAP